MNMQNRAMPNASTSVVAIATLSLVANAFFAYRLWGPESASGPTAEATDVPIVMRTKGGLLEVSTIQEKVRLDSANDERVLFDSVSIGQTVSTIRAPVVYRYHVELAPEWRILKRKDAFVVIAPSVKSTLPVAIDTTKIELQSSGMWSLLTGQTRLQELARTMTPLLAKKAASPSYIQFQRDHARQAVQEFVAKWLVTQEQWKAQSKLPIQVFFADESIEAMKSLPQPFAGTL